MFRSIVTCVIILASVGLTTDVSASIRIAVLGLEVAGTDSSVDVQATRVAKTLSTALRKRVRTGGGPYRLASNGDKDLLEMKLLSDCSTERVSCMTKIGRELRVGRLVYGKLQRRNDGYRVTLSLLNVAKQKMERTTADIIPQAKVSPEGLKRWGSILYDRLIGRPTHGKLVVRTNVDKGVVYIDGQAKGVLRAGTVTIARTDRGLHRLIVESEGYEKHSEQINIVPGKTVRTQITLTRSELTHSRGGGVHRKLFWTSLVMTGAGATAMTITGLQVRGSLADAKDAAVSDFNNQNPDMPLRVDNACADVSTRGNVPGAAEVKDACDKGKSRARLTNVFLGATVAGAVAAGYFYYRGYASSGSTREKKSAQQSTKPLRITPSIGPTHVGAGVELEF